MKNDLGQIDLRLRKIERKIEEIHDALVKVDDPPTILDAANPNSAQKVTEMAQNRNRVAKFKVVAQLCPRKDENSRTILLLAIDRYPNQTVFDVEMAMRRVLEIGPKNGDYASWFANQLKWQNENQLTETDGHFMNVQEWKNNVEAEQEESLRRIRAEQEGGNGES